MKNYFFKASLLGVVMLFSGLNANAQINLGSIVSSVKDKVTSSSSSSSSSSTSASDIVSTITSIFSSSKQATTNNIVGTWVYNEPAIVLSSSNILSSTAAKVAANQIESKLQTQLDKVGIKQGAMKITFSSDGTFTETLGSKTISGKWTISDSKLNLTYASKTVSITTQISGSTLQLVVDASKLLTLFQTLGSKVSSSSLSTITSLMSSIDGMQVGLSFEKS